MKKGGQGMYFLFSSPFWEKSQDSHDTVSPKKTLSLPKAMASAFFFNSLQFIGLIK